MTDDKKTPGTLKKLADSPALEWIFAGLAVAVASFARLRQLGFYGLNTDECYNYLWAKDSLFTRLAQDIHPPLYPFLSKFFGWAGIEMGTRLVSALSGIAFVILVGWLARRAFGRGVGILSIWFAALAPQLIWISRTGLSYQLFATLVALSVLTYVRLEESATKGRMTLHTLSLAACLYSFHLGIPVWIFFLLAAVMKFRANKMRHRNLLLATIGAGLVYLPMLVSLVFHFDRVAAATPLTWWQAGPWQIIRSCLMIFMHYTPAAPLSLTAKIQPVLGTVVLLLVGLPILFFGTLSAIKNNRSQPTTAMILGVFFFPLMVTLLLHYIVRMPLEEYFFSFASLTALPIVACACLWPRRKIVSVIFILALAFLNMKAFGAIKNIFTAELRTAVTRIDERSTHASLVMTIDFNLVDAYKVYGRRNLDVIGLPADLSGHDKVYPEQVGVVVPEDRAAFLDAIKGRNEVFLMVAAAKSGMPDRGTGLVGQWFDIAGFETADIAAYVGSRMIKVTRYERKASAKEALP